MFNPHTVPFGQTMKIPGSFYRNNRARLVNNLKATLGDKFTKNSFIFMRSQGEYLPNHDDDCGQDQFNNCEVNFFYLFGCSKYYDMYGIINMDTNEATLSVADSTTIERVISKLLSSGETVPEDVNVDKVISNSKLEAFFDHQADLGQIFINEGHLGRNRKPSLIPEFEW